MKQRRWIGRWLAAVGIVHSLFGVIFMHGALAVLWQEGLFNTINGQPEREFPFWFIFTGLLMIILGALVDRNEALAIELPSWLGWSLLALVGICLVVMPISGAWLIVPPTVGAIARSRARAGHDDR